MRILSSLIILSGDDKDQKGEKFPKTFRLAKSIFSFLSTVFPRLYGPGFYKVKSFESTQNVPITVNGTLRTRFVLPNLYHLF